MPRRQATRIYIDSRFALADGSVDIPGGIDTEPNSRAWVSEFSCTATWWTIEPDVNDTLYVMEKVSPILTNFRALTLQPGPHDMESLTTEIAAKLNGPGKDGAMGTYSCTRVTGAPGGGAGGGTARSLLISCTSGQFQLPSEALIRTEFDIPQPSLTHSTDFIVAFPTGDTMSTSHVSSFTDLRPFHNLYLHIEGMGSYNCLGPLGSSNIFAKIPVSVGYGVPLSFNFPDSMLESIQVGTHNVTRLKIELKDVFGTTINLRGGHWSATLVFEDKKIFEQNQKHHEREKP